jgi:SAM-dependent methyltransferase
MSVGVRTASQPAGLAEPFLTQFVQLVRRGAAAHDMVITQGRAVVPSDAFVNREVERAQFHARNVVRYLTQLHPLRIVDVGCGTGGLTVALAATFPEAAVTGIDIDSLTLEAARVRAAGSGISATFVQAESDAPLPFPDRSFDLVTCASVLEFLTIPASRRGLAREMVRIANGHIVITTPNPLVGIRERHTRRWLGDVRRRLDKPWASSWWELDRLFAPCEPVAVPARVDDKLGFTLPRRLHPLVEAVMPWQFKMYRYPPPQ